MTSSNSIQLPIASTRLRSLILQKTFIHVIYTNDPRKQGRSTTNEDDFLQYIPNLPKKNKIKFQQNLVLHNHPDTFIHKCDATYQTEYTTIRPKTFSKNLSNRTRTSLEKAKLVSYWPSDDNDSTDDELQQDPPEATLDEIFPHKTYTYITF